MDLHSVAINGVVSAADAARLGIGPYELRRLCALGLLRRMIRGWYAVWPPGHPLPPWQGKTRWESQHNHHRLLTAALVRSFDGRAAASHGSALVLHAGRLHLVDLATAHLCRLSSENTRHRKHAVLHPSINLPVTEVAGLACVPPAVAAIQVGLIERAGAPAQPIASLVAADGFLHDRVINLADLAGAMDVFRGHPGIPAVRSILAHADGLHESVGETLLAACLRGLGYHFAAQARHGDYRVDFELVGEPVIIEFDGLGKYGADLADPTPDDLRRALGREKGREDALRQTGYVVVRITWRDLHTPKVVFEKVEQARAQARRAHASTR